MSEQQIAGILREPAAGAKTADICRNHGVSLAAFYKWKSKFGGMEVSDAAKMRTLEDRRGAQPAMTNKLVAPTFDGESPKIPASLMSP